MAETRIMAIQYVFAFPLLFKNPSVLAKTLLKDEGLCSLNFLNKISSLLGNQNDTHYVKTFINCFVS